MLRELQLRNLQKQKELGAHVYFHVPWDDLYINMLSSDETEGETACGAGSMDSVNSYDMPW